jgi:hypothetical protein
MPVAVGDENLPLAVVVPDGRISGVCQFSSDIDTDKCCGFSYLGPLSFLSAGVGKGHRNREDDGCQPEELYDRLDAEGTPTEVELIAEIERLNREAEEGRAARQRTARVAKKKAARHTADNPEAARSGGDPCCSSPPMVGQGRHALIETGERKSIQRETALKMFGPRLSADPVHPVVDES